MIPASHLSHLSCQVDKTATELRRSGYFDVRMLETLAVNWGVKSAAADAAKRRRTEATEEEKDRTLENAH